MPTPHSGRAPRQLNPTAFLSPLVAGLLKLRRGRWITLRISELFFGLRAFGTENIPTERPVIFVGNHGSHFDAFFSLAVIYRETGNFPVGVAWPGMRDYPFVEDIIQTRIFDVIWQDNEARHSQGLQTLHQMVHRLGLGSSVLILPEGRRNDRLGTFRPGAAAAAILSGSPILPFTLCGVQGLFSSPSGPERFTGKVSFHFHPVIEPECSKNPADLQTGARLLMQKVRNRVASALDYPDAFADNAADTNDQSGRKR